MRNLGFSIPSLQSNPFFAWVAWFAKADHVDPFFEHGYMPTSKVKWNDTVVGRFPATALRIGKSVKPCTRSDQRTSRSTQTQDFQSINTAKDMSLHATSQLLLVCQLEFSWIFRSFVGRSSVGRLWANGLFLLPGFQFERLATDFVDTGSSGSSAWSQWDWWFQGKTDGEKSGEQWHRHSYFAGQRYLMYLAEYSKIGPISRGRMTTHPSRPVCLTTYINYTSRAAWAMLEPLIGIIPPKKYRTIPKTCMAIPRPGLFVKYLGLKFSYSNSIQSYKRKQGFLWGLFS